MAPMLKRSNRTTHSPFLRAFLEAEHPRPPDCEITCDTLADRLTARFNDRAPHAAQAMNAPPVERLEFSAWRTFRILTRRVGELRTRGSFAKHETGPTLGDTPSHIVHSREHQEAPPMTNAESARPKRAKPGEQQKKRRLTDAYATEAQRDTLLRGDELSELEAVGKKSKSARER
jgi:hypothetical protein